MAGGFKKCPYCAEEILAEAIKCKHCHELIDRKACTRARKEANKKETSPVAMSCAVLLAVIVASCAHVCRYRRAGAGGQHDYARAPSRLEPSRRIVLCVCDCHYNPRGAGHGDQSMGGSLWRRRYGPRENRRQPVAASKGRNLTPGATRGGGSLLLPREPRRPARMGARDDG